MVLRDINSSFSYLTPAVCLLTKTTTQSPSNAISLHVAYNVYYMHCCYIVCCVRRFSGRLVLNQSNISTFLCRCCRDIFSESSRKILTSFCVCVLLKLLYIVIITRGSWWWFNPHFYNISTSCTLIEIINGLFL